ncbi:hypothetical protein AQUCO_04700120v1 [Aquilegia coerulea]|uniref:Uncharacterized protein n=1 Tax=Aquilegia coerulea TaxID=218851 RepID=A0A2G5CL95_AQUCA|nr:hypothetical protein AQUCO_04700120v1 [Aquilegia coerulea]
MGFIHANRLVMIQILLTSKGITLNPVKFVYYVGPCYLVLLFVQWKICVETGCFFVGGEDYYTHQECCY